MEYQYRPTPLKLVEMPLLQNSFFGNFKKTLQDNKGSFVAARKETLREESIFHKNKNKNKMIKDATESAESTHTEEKYFKPIKSMQNEEEKRHFFNKLPIHTECKTKENELITIQLTKCELLSLPLFFYELKFLRSLSLSQNKFSHLDSRMGKLGMLEWLDLSENNLMELPPSFHHLNKLKYLNLSNNSLSNLGIQPILELHEERKRHEQYCIERLKSNPGNRSREAINPKTGKKIYFDLVTRRSSNTKPLQNMHETSSTRFQIPSKFNKFILKDSLLEYRERKNFLEINNIPEWVISMDQDTGHSTYFNNVSGQSQSILPLELDSIGNLFNLECLKANENKLTELPPSISRINTLNRLEVRNNNLRELPKDFGGLTNLRILRADFNRLQCLPKSMCQCKKIVELNISHNMFDLFPSSILSMKKIEILSLGNNCIRSLPYTIGFMQNLSVLMLYNNPLQDPEYDEAMKGIKRTLWICREKHFKKVQGEVPVMKMKRSGIEKECLMIDPEYDAILKSKIYEGTKSHSRVKLRNFNLKSLPYELSNVHGLLELDLSRNNFEQIPIEFPDSLCSLLHLSLKCCKISEITPSIKKLRYLSVLDLEMNFIVELPKEISRLRKLKHLHLSNNRIQCIPNLSELTDLKEINLDCNKMQQIPDGISSLRNMEVLNLSRNSIRTIDPDLLATHKTLKKLDLKLNMISYLPKDFGKLHLMELKLSGNRLKRLEDDCFLPSLIHTAIWIDNNNLIELPRCIVKLTNLKDLKIAINPFRSPPRDILAKGINFVLEYCRERSRRRDELERLLKKADFVFDLDNCRAKTTKFLNGNTGFLTPKDLRDFDHLVDAHLNGNFLSLSTSITDVVNRIAELRKKRQNAVFNRVLESILNIAWDNLNLLSFSSEYKLRSDIRRRWGRNSEHVTCFAFPKKFLLEGRKNQKSLKALALTALDDITSLFEIDDETFTKAFCYESPFGKVAQIEQVSFDQYDATNKTDNAENLLEVKHESIVIARIIYTEEEAERRKEEDSMMHNYFNLLDDRIHLFCKSNRGGKSVDAEIKRQSKKISNEIKELRVELKKLGNELCILHEGISVSKRRKANFEQGKPFAFHRICTTSEANEVVSICERNARALEEKYEEIRRDICSKKAEQKKMQRKEMYMEVIAVLKKQNCHKIFDKIIEYGRTYAYHNDLRRPWDGEDGSDYHQFKEQSLDRIVLVKSKSSTECDLERQCNAKEYSWTGDVNFNSNFNKYYKSFLEQKRAKLFDGATKSISALQEKTYFLKVRRKGKLV